MIELMYVLEYNEKQKGFHLDVDLNKKESFGWVRIADRINDFQFAHFEEFLVITTGKSEGWTLKQVKSAWNKHVLYVSNLKNRHLRYVYVPYLSKDQLDSSDPILKQQQNLVASIKNELSKENESYKPSSFWHSVWFQPSSGRFLFGDRYTIYEVVEPLIESQTLVFTGVENHQGEKMLRYVLA